PTLPNRRRIHSAGSRRPGCFDCGAGHPGGTAGWLHFAPGRLHPADLRWVYPVSHWYWPSLVDLRHGHAATVLREPAVSWFRQWTGDLGGLHSHPGGCTRGYGGHGILGGVSVL